MPNGNNSNTSAYPAWSFYVAILGSFGFGAGGTSLMGAADPPACTSCAVNAAKIKGVQETVQRLQRQIDQIDREGPRVGNKDYERRISRLEHALDPNEN